jgi:sulfur carrier protein ThiS
MKKKLAKSNNKKIVKKAKAAKKKVVVKKSAVAKPKAKKNKPIGKVTHFYTHIKVAIIKFNTPIKTGTELYLKGATTDFKEIIKSMQFDHKPVAVAKKGKLIGIKLKKRVREGDLVYKV